MATVASIIAHLGLEPLEISVDREIQGVLPLDQATQRDISFLSNAKYRAQLATTKAGAVLVEPRYVDQVPQDCVAIAVDNPYAFLPILLRLFHPETTPAPGIHPSAVIAEGVSVPVSAHIGAHVVIEHDATVGEATRIDAGCFVGQGASIGNNSHIYPNVTIGQRCKVGARVIVHSGTVIGSDGFGFAPTANGLEKIPQVGIVEIEDDVEIGSNCSIDRATFGVTRICRGVKLDNLIQVAHNVTIGPHTVIAAQTGIAGSTNIGGACMIGGQVAISGHIEIGDGVMLAGRTGVVQSVQPGEKLGGTPAMPFTRWLRLVKEQEKLPETLRKLQKRQS